MTIIFVPYLFGQQESMVCVHVFIWAPVHHYTVDHCPWLLRHASHPASRQKRKDQTSSPAAQINLAFNQTPVSAISQQAQQLWHGRDGIANQFWLALFFHQMHQSSQTASSRCVCTWRKALRSHLTRMKSWKRTPFSPQTGANTERSWAVSNCIDSLLMENVFLKSKSLSEHA